MIFFVLLEDINALDKALRHPERAANSYLPLPSPHIPIAALAANRVIIIVINITFLPFFFN